LPQRPVAWDNGDGDGAGWWPVAVVTLNTETYEDMPHLREFLLVICVYQLMWEELVAWPIPVQKRVCTTTWVGQTYIYYS
jgi:hypothetical protein